MEDSKPVNGFTCRFCNNQYDVIEFRKTYKSCKACNNLRSSADHFKWRNNPDNRQKWKEYRKAHKRSPKGLLCETECGRRNMKKRRDTLSPVYCRGMLKIKGFSKEQITPDLIELQKAIILNKRLCRTLENSEIH